MKSYNHIILKGSLGKDARVNTFNERQVASFSVATEYNYKKQDGTYSNETTWVDVCAWAGFGICDLERLKKGVKVLVSGRLRRRNYTDNKGLEREMVEVLADSVDIIDDGAISSRQKPSNPTSKQSDNKPINNNDELPF